MRIGGTSCASRAYAVAAPACAAQTAARPRDVKLHGRARRAAASSSSDIQKVAISEPKIADAVVISPREVMVNAKGPGHTTLIIWETGADPAPLRGRRRQGHHRVGRLPQADRGQRRRRQSVTVTGTGETIVLTGTVKTAEDSKRLAGMAQTRAKTVINLLQAPPAARTAADSAAGEVRRHRPRGAHASSASTSSAPTTPCSAA